MSLEEQLSAIQSSLVAKFEEIRTTFTHSGNKGSGAEANFRNFVRSYVPRTFRVGHGEVIDSRGKRSKQLDVIVGNPHHPFVTTEEDACLHFIEGVACAGEVKSILTTDELERTLENCLAFKKLHAFIAKDTSFRGTMGDVERFVLRRPYFLFAYESQLKLQTVAEKIAQWSNDRNLYYYQGIDGVFLIDRGVIVNFGKGDGAFTHTFSDGQKAVGLVPYHATDNPNTLYHFLIWLTSTVKDIQVPASILQPYLGLKQPPTDSAS